MADKGKSHERLLGSGVLDEAGVRELRGVDTEALISLLARFGGTTEGVYASRRETLKAVIDWKNAEAADKAAQRMIDLTEKIYWLTWVMGGLAVLQLVQFFVDISKR